MFGKKILLVDITLIEPVFVIFHVQKDEHFTFTVKIL